MDYLDQRGEYSSPGKAPRPGIILLDLNRPGTDGRKVWDVVNHDANLKSTPIVVLTISSDDRDIDAIFASGANSDIVQPATVEGIIKTVQKLENLWSFRF